MRYLLLLCVAMLPACGLVQHWRQAAALRACADTTSAAEAAIGACSGLLAADGLSADERNVVLFWKAQAHQRAGDTLAALRALTALIEADPGNADAYGYRGALHGQRTELKAALADFDRALELDPTSEAALGNRGKARADTGDHARAIEDFDRLIALAPGNAAAYNGRCWSRAVLGRDLDAARADCDQAIRLQPEDGNSFNSRGFLRYRQDDTAGAVRDYDRALALAPDVASSYYMRAQAKRRLHDATAADDLRRALALEPGVAQRYAGYGIDAAPADSGR